MTVRAILSLSVGVIAFVVWRRQRVVTSNFLSGNDFPVGYYAHGDHETQCKIVKDEVANEMSLCEDATFWDLRGADEQVLDRVLLVSSDKSRKDWDTLMGPAHDPKQRGSLWIHRIRDAGARPQRVELVGYSEDLDFHPLGLEIYPSCSGNSSDLYVVNHARYESTIEHFLVPWTEPTRAQWVRTLSSPDFVSPNALALTSPTPFYVTNDHLLTRRLPGFLGKILPVMETILALPFSWATHVAVSGPSESPRTTAAAPYIPFANGISVSRDGKTVAIASTSAAMVYFYQRDPATHALTYAAGVPVPMTPDNVAFDDDGVLIVAGHPHIPSLAAVAEGVPGARAPSWVVAIRPREHAARVPKAYDVEAPVSAAGRAPAVRSHEVETLYQSNGAAFSTSAATLRDSATGRLYLTGLFQDGFMVCSP